MDKNSECDFPIFNIFGNLVYHEKSNTSDLKFNIQIFYQGSYIAKLVLHDLRYSCLFLKF